MDNFESEQRSASCSTYNHIHKMLKGAMKNGNTYWEWDAIHSLDPRMIRMLKKDNIIVEITALKDRNDCFHHRVTQV